MSHYTVMVIGDNVDEQLAPFDENRANEFFGVTDAGEQARWDWYQIGGRWAGSLTVKPLFADQVPAIDFSWGWSPEDKAKVANGYRCDQARKGWLDIEAMIEQRREAKRASYAGARKELAEYPERAQTLEFMWGIKPDELEPEHEEAAVAAITRPIEPYAVLAEGTWHEPGPMGWFGFDSSTDETKAAFETWFADFWDELPDDTLITIVDCHI